MAQPRRPLPEALRGQPFTVALAAAHGASEKSLRHPSLRRPTRGVRLPDDAVDDLPTRCEADALAISADAAFSHGTALRLRGIDLPWPIDRDDEVHVTLPRIDARPTRAGVRSHWTDQPLLVTDIGVLRVTTPVQTWLHLAATLSPDEVVVLGDAMMRRKSPLLTPADLRRAVRACPAGTRGIRRMRRALELTRAGTDSCMESRTRLALVAVGLACPLVNEPIYDARGRFVALPDLSYPALKIAIEYDGDIHRTDPATWRRDVERRQRLEELGWLIITVTADDVLRFPDRLAARVRLAILTRHPLAESGETAP